MQLFKVAKELFDQYDVPTNIRVVINETKRPTGGHPRRYNSPMCNGVDVLMPNENLNNRDKCCITGMVASIIFQSYTGDMIYCSIH